MRAISARLKRRDDAGGGPTDDRSGGDANDDLEEEPQPAGTPNTADGPAPSGSRFSLPFSLPSLQSLTPTMLAPKGSMVAKSAACQVDTKKLREAIKRCTDAARLQRSGQSTPEQVQVLLGFAAEQASKCHAWGDQIQVLLERAETEDGLAALLQTNDELQAVLKRWDTLLSLGIGDMANRTPQEGQGSQELYTSEVGMDVLQAIGEEPEPIQGAGDNLHSQLQSLQEANQRLSQQVSEAEAARSSALASMAATHAQEVNQTKSLAVLKMKELMERVQKLEESQGQLEAAEVAARERADAAEAAAATASVAAASLEEKDEVGSAEVRRLTSDVQRLKAQLESAIANQQSAQAEVQRLKSLVGELEVQAMEAKQEAAQAHADGEAKAAAKAAEFVALQGEVSTLSKRAASAEQYKVEMEAAKASVTSMQLELRKESILRKKAYNQIREMKGNIRVMCRSRPAVVSNGRVDESPELAVEVGDEFTLSLSGTRKYEFDTCFPPEATQEQVYEETQALLQSAFDGYNVCIFCYGQTGSGKTHTITGSTVAPGIIPRAMGDIFSSGSETSSVQVSCYMVELYQDMLLDLLSSSKENPKLNIKRDPKGAVLVDGTTVKPAASAEELMSIFRAGLDGRKVASTKMNSESSRSHLIFTILLEVTNLTIGSKASSKLTFVDLAGSERVSRSGAINDKDRLKEAQAINKSLSALGDVVAALTSGDSFVPYRNHKLTQLMSDSLGGNAKTLMIVNISPLKVDAPETKNSLDYATRVKQVTNENSRSYETREIQKLKAEIAKLKGSENK